MLEILGAVCRRIGNWVEMYPLPEPETRSMFTSFYPPRTGADAAEAALLSSLMADSVTRFRRGLGEDTKQL